MLRTGGVFGPKKSTGFQLRPGNDQPLSVGCSRPSHRPSRLPCLQVGSSRDTLQDICLKHFRTALTTL